MNALPLTRHSNTPDTTTGRPQDGGTSQENRSYGFLPAFLDTCTGAVYISRFADGRVAPMHLLDGLPPELVVKRSATGRVLAVTVTVTAGFVRSGEFYTREQAAKVVMEHQALTECMPGPGHALWDADKDTESRHERRRETSARALA